MTVAHPYDPMCLKSTGSGDFDVSEALDEHRFVVTNTSGIRLENTSNKTKQVCFCKETSVSVLIDCKCEWRTIKPIQQNRFEESLENLIFRNSLLCSSWEDGSVDCFEDGESRTDDQLQWMMSAKPSERSFSVKVTCCFMRLTFDIVHVRNSCFGLLLLICIKHRTTDLFYS